MGDRELLRDCVEACVIESPRLVEAITKNDGKALNCAAHSLKSSLAFLQVDAAWQSAQQLDTAGSGGDFEQAQQAAAIQSPNFQELAAALTEFLQRD